MVKKTFTGVGSALLVMLFLYTALSKLLDMNTFRFQLGRMPFIGGFADQTQWLIPVTELIIVALLATRVTQKIGLLSSVVLLGLFTVYLTIAVSHSDKLPCSCGGIISLLSWKQHIILNISFMIIGATAFVFESQQPQNKQHSWFIDKQVA